MRNGYTINMEEIYLNYEVIQKPIFKKFCYKTSLTMFTKIPQKKKKHLWI